MKNLLISPSKMSLSASQSAIYQKILEQVAPLSLNLMAVKVERQPDDFLAWCHELLDVCVNRINRDLMDEIQFKPLKKVISLLTLATSVTQLTMAKAAPWVIYQEFINSQAQRHGLEERLRLLDFVSKLDTSTLSELSVEDRLAFVGKHTNDHDTALYNFDVQWFGQTKTAKGFHELLSVNPAAFDDALSKIPDEGEVTQSQFADFVGSFMVAIISTGEKPSLAVATRLLAMKRPDQFVTISSTKLDELCQGLNIAKLKLHDFEAYWTDVIGTIRTMPWYSSEQPSDESELALWNNRVVLMDLLFWCDEEHAQQSNYLKLKNKPARKSTSKAGGGKVTRRSKESSTEIVDRVLAMEGTSDFIKAQRNSIIAQVESGKKIDEVITLLSKIFG
ncbi:hypothetical protein ACMAZF_07780 [Psychrobium sp. nBUS_13]|uniref:hypothetical protein n=1 Tax=Psychrobium sp. nBUS_13 TaxID=3395319 RepID=UPI003EB6A4EE